MESKESILPVFEPGGPVRQIGLLHRPARLGIDSWAPLKIRALDACCPIDL
jgi:hypothetical protein